MAVRILTVEDDERIQAAMRLALEDEGYTVVEAASGEEGLEAFSRRPADVVLIDLMLPGIDGFEVCRQVRRAGVDTPIVLLTARAQEAEKVLGLEAGADDYVTKPYSARELRARIKAHLRRSAGQASEVHRFGDAELDFGRCELRRGGNVVDLSALEFKLLSAFVKRSGRLLSRAQLLDEVWGSGTHVTDRVVDNQVTNLRKKIEPDPERPRYLIALRGLGYRFDGEGVTEP